MSIRESCFEESPIFMTRLVADSGCIMIGGAAQVGNDGRTVSRRSWHQLPGRHHIGPRVEDQLDRRQLGNRLGAHHVEPRHSVERLLQRNRDQAFHFGRGQPEACGLNLHARRRELGKDVHRHGAELAAANDHHRHGESNHQISKL